MRFELISECPVETTLNVLGNKWVVLIIRELLKSPKRHSELKKSINGITQKVLTSNLKKLEANGVVYREVLSKKPIHVEYSLTEFGKSLENVLFSMQKWGKELQQSVKGQN
ncbi:helix-turn-helix transcriptional regulator [Spiroplasma chinense]|uniref:Helix-turn-helix transcriptional regulator n=1 Tax=Spiroplasma chinense TaxID=216932 RepID=A0A5B9Y3V8_9MOLU|nr:helix-turn-helix domain-containing protein [Spiroplasma chinense]QEH61356.1 helix-turn-helix transcriptional regulator [Spiroplasma chinense]